jgi:hypothetical protein
MNHRMKRMLLIMCSLMFIWADGSWVFARSNSLPPYPRAATREGPDLAGREKARRLFYIAQEEHPSLAWDECLASKARRRARFMARAGYFDHSDPATGVNPVWELVASCSQYSRAGENLSRGYQSPETIHRAFMESETHRRNILNPRFERLGVGCYDFICVQLFGGF